jgi:membrane peptidoglycan carboxypeptidase
MKRLLILLSLALLALLAVGVYGGVRFADVYRDTAAMADAHMQHLVAHPGWSYPAHVYSSPEPLDGPFDRVILEAKARGYKAVCPPSEPGQYCAKTGDFYLVGGVFPEGRQPPGHVTIPPKEGKKKETKETRENKEKREKKPSSTAEKGAQTATAPWVRPSGWTRDPALEPVFMGILLGEETEWREHLPLSEAPDLLVKAIVAAEDGSFYAHHGVDLMALVRATAANTEAKTYSQGGSTLTMQVVRGFSQARDKAMARKVREILSAVALDHYMGKAAILSAYLDLPYLGQLGSISVCGFKTAAMHYFAVPVEKLTLAQAATLAAILPAPGRYSPFTNPEAARERRDRVLHSMAELGLASPADVAAALATPVETREGPFPEEKYEAYLAAVHQYMDKTLPRDVVYGAGLQVFTGLDVAAQDATDKVIVDRLKTLSGMLPHASKEPLQCAVVGIDPPTGRVRVLYGGRGTTSTGFNRATQARRQGGSAFKPVVYAAALSMRDEKGEPLYTAASAFINTIRDFKTPTGIWRPRNVCGEYTPTACLAYALVWSQNIASASLLEDIGLDRFLDYAKTFGFDTSGFPHEFGLALGQGEVTVEEMSRFAAMIANGGKRIDFHPVEVAIDAAGQVRFQRPPPGPQVMREEDATLVRLLMEQVVASGTGGRVHGTGGYPGYQGEIFGKTGTTDEEKDLWFMGGTPDVAGAVWLGYDDPVRIGATGSDLTAPMFGWWERAVHEGLASLEWVKDPEIEMRSVCNITGKRPNASCLTTQAPFLKGTAPGGACPLTHEKVEPPLGEEGEDVGDDVEFYKTATPSGRPLGDATTQAPGAKKKRRSIWEQAEDEEAADPGAATDGTQTDAKKGEPKKAEPKKAEPKKAEPKQP